MVGVDDVDYVGVAAHPGALASAAFTIARHVASRDAVAAGRRRRQQTSAS